MKALSVTKQLIQTAATERSMAMAKDNEPRIKYLNERLNLLHRLEHCEDDLAHADAKESVWLNYKINTINEELAKLEAQQRKKNSLY